MREEDFKSKFKSGAQVLKDLLENRQSPMSADFLRWKIWAHWGDYVGPTIKDVTEPVGYRQGLLYIWVKNSAWMNELQFGKTMIQDHINEKVGHTFVRDIRFTLDRKSVPHSSQSQEAFKTFINSVAPSTKKPE